MRLGKFYLQKKSIYKQTLYILLLLYSDIIVNIISNRETKR